MEESGTYDMEDLIGKVLTSEASADELQAVEDWCALSPDNQKYFDHVKRIYDKSILREDVYDTEAAWIKVKQRILDTKTRTLWPVTASRIAASLLLISMVSYLAYWQFFAAEKAEFIAESEVTVHTLTDNTEVSLNRNSEVKVNYNPRKKTGVILLKGEATVEISPERKVEWLVQADEVFIRDIGTTFNVRAYPQEPTIEVSVLEGEVQFYTAVDEGLFLKAGEKGLYDRTSKSFSVERADINVISYKTRMFTFDNTDLKSVVRLISIVYNRRIVLPAELDKCRLTVDFNNEDFETLIDVIAETLNLRVIYAEDEVRLEGEGCQ